MREYFPGEGTILGVSWKSKNEEFGSFNSMSLLDWAGILREPRARYVDLQYGDTAGERGTLEARTGVHIEHLPELDLFNDIDGLFALCAACDLVITASNVNAHVAGALGRPVWLLVPKAKGNSGIGSTTALTAHGIPRCASLPNRRREPGTKCWTQLHGNLLHLSRREKQVSERENM